MCRHSSTSLSSPVSLQVSISFLSCISAGEHVFCQHGETHSCSVCPVQVISLVKVDPSLPSSFTLSSSSSAFLSLDSSLDHTFFTKRVVFGLAAWPPRPLAFLFVFLCAVSPRLCSAAGPLHPFPWRCYADLLLHQCHGNKLTTWVSRHMVC